MKKPIFPTEVYVSTDCDPDEVAPTDLYVYRSENLVDNCSTGEWIAIYKLVRVGKLSPKSFTIDDPISFCDHQDFKKKL